MKKNIIGWVRLITVFGLFFGAAIYLSNNLKKEGQRIKDGADEVYTICTVTGVYLGSKFSRNIEFYLDSIRVEDHCENGVCGNSKVGTRYFIRTWRDHTDYWEIVYDIEVPPLLHAPPAGWDTIPIR